MKYPIRALAGNLLFTSSGAVWALWRIAPGSYRHATRAAKHELLADTEALLKSLTGDYQLISVCPATDPADVVTRMLDGVDLAHSGAFAQMCENVLDRLEHADLRTRERYLAVPLPALTGTRGRLSSLSAAAALITGAAGAAAVGRVGEREIAARLEQARALRATWPGRIALSEADPATVLWLYARAARRGLAEPLIPAPDAAARPRTGLGALDEVLLDEGARTDRPVGRARGPVNPFARRYLKAMTEHGSSYQAFLCLAEMPAAFAFPGSEWMASLEDFEFPIEWTVHARGVPRAEAEAKTRRQARELRAQVGQYTGDDGDETNAPHALAEAREALEDERARLAASSSELELQTTTVLCVYADNPAEAQRRAEAVRLAYGAADYQLSRPTGGQLACYTALLPGAGTPRMLRDYTQYTLARDFSMAMPFAGTEIGDTAGTLYALSLSGSGVAPVLTDFSLGPRVDASASAAFIGELGSGKSVAMKAAAFAVLARGRRAGRPGTRGRVLAVDRTPSGEWVRFLSVCPGSTQVIEITDNAAISLDPLRIFEGESAARYTEAFLTSLLQVRTMSEEDMVLSEAIAATVRAGRPSMLALAKRLTAAAKSDPAGPAAVLARKLRVIARKGQARALFDPSLAPLTVSAADSIVFSVSRMSLPGREELASEIRLARLPFEKLFGQAVLVLLTAVCREVAFADAREFVLSVWDECWWLASSPEGRDLMLELVRDGRKHNSAAHFGLHDSGDLGSGDEAAETLRGLISLRYLFRHRAAPLAARGLEFLGLDGADGDLLDLVTKGLSPLSVAEADRGERAGECLHRDLAGRLGLIKILIPPLEEIAQAILTTPQSDDQAAEQLSDEDLLEAAAL